MYTKGVAEESQNSTYGSEPANNARKRCITNNAPTK